MHVIGAVISLSLPFPSTLLCQLLHFEVVLYKSLVLCRSGLFLSYQLLVCPGGWLCGDYVCPCTSWCPPLHNVVHFVLENFGPCIVHDLACFI